MKNQFTIRTAGILLLFFCLSLLIGGCTKEAPVSTEYASTVDGQDIIISFPTGTKSEGIIASEKGEYTFSYSLDGTLTIIYPNGFIYSQKTQNGGTASSWEYNETAEDLGFIGGYSLAWTIESASRTESSNTKAVSPVLSVLIVAVGVWFTWNPKSVWWLARGWMFKNVEPSDLAVGIYRGVGIVIVIVGAISFFV